MAAGLSLVARPPVRLAVVVARQKYPDVVRALLVCGCMHPREAAGEGSLRAFARRLRGEVELLASRLREVLEKAPGAGGGEPEARLRLSRRLEESIAGLVEEIGRLADEVESLVSRWVELTTPGTESWRLMRLLELYSEVDVDLEELGRARYVRARIYRVPVRRAAGFEADASRAGAVVYTAPGGDRENAMYLVVYPAAAEEAVAEAARRNAAQPLQLPEGLPANPAKALQRLRELLDQLPALTERHAPEARRALRSLEALVELLRILEATRLTRTMAVVEGYVSPGDVARLSRALDEATGGAYAVFTERPVRLPAEHAGVHGEEAGGEEVEPTEILYPRLLKPFAELIEIYGHPRPLEIVPLALTAITVPVIFGLMFPDLGHGLVLFLAGLYLALRGSGGMRTVGELAVYMGAAAMVFGFLAGEFFGADPRLAGWLTELWHGHPPYSSPIHPIAEAVVAGEGHVTGELINMLIMKAIFISLFLGSALLALASWLGVAGAYIRGDRHELVAALGRALTFTGVFTVFTGAAAIAGFEGYTALGPILARVTMLPIEAEQTPATLLFANTAAALIYLGLLVTFLAPVLLEHGESLGMRLMNGIIEVFDTILLAVGNTASFIRILGLMIAHSSLMFTFLVIALQTPLVVGAIVYLLGNLLVIGLESLIATAHTLRLHFYEMYSKFYQGGGVPFAPARLPARTRIEIV